MTTMQELGERAVACEGWRWMSGMRLRREGECRVVRLFDKGVSAFYSVAEPLEVSRSLVVELGIPDLTDPATIGCLEHLVLMACHSITTHKTHEGWTVEIDDGLVRDCPTFIEYAEALVCALEAV